jgi:hypothetical protein
MTTLVSNLAAFGGEITTSAGTPLNVSAGGTGITNVSYVGVNFIINGGGSTITSGVKGYVEIPFSCIITNWSIILSSGTGAAVTDSITADVLGAMFNTSTVPTSSITGGGISVSSATGATSNTSLWTTTSLAANV